MPAERVSLTQQETIEQYVRDLGGGFLFAGGENGYGLGGWYHTTIERILPVRMDAEKRRDEPEVAMALVIDRSGSMTGLPLEMAKQAAKATADTLAGRRPARGHRVRLAADAHRAHDARQAPRAHPERHRAHPGRRRHGDLPGARRRVPGPLDDARAQESTSSCSTDGQAPQSGIRDLVQAMAAEDITVTTVGLGGGVDESLLRMISDVGGGRFYKVADPQSLAAHLHARDRDGEPLGRRRGVLSAAGRRPRPTFCAAIDVASAPFLHGYVATKMKPPPAQEILESELGEPILARWHVGLGWTMAWTSDVKNLWAVEWLRWPQWGQFWGQLVREHMRQKKRQVFDMRAEIDPATGHVRARTRRDRRRRPFPERARRPR